MSRKLGAGIERNRSVSPGKRVIGYDKKTRARSSSPSKRRKDSRPTESIQPAESRKHPTIVSSVTVGSELSVRDQFDIVVLISPSKIYTRNLKEEDDISSVTTDEYRKYGNFCTYLSLHDCCGSSQKAVAAPATTSPNTTQAVSNGEPMPTAEARDDAPVMQTTFGSQSDSFAGNDWCCLFTTTKTDKSSKKEKEEVVDRTASLFDDTLKADADAQEEEEATFNTGGLANKARWRKTLSRALPWARRQGKVADVEQTDQAEEVVIEHRERGSSPIRRSCRGFSPQRRATSPQRRATSPQRRARQMQNPIDSDDGQAQVQQQVQEADARPERYSRSRSPRRRTRINYSEDYYLATG